MRPKTLDDLTGPWKRANQIVYRDCPMCGRDTWKLYVHPESGVWHCFGCNAAGVLDLGMGNALALLYATTQAPAKWDPMELPPFQRLSDKACDHLWEKYGLSPEQAARYSLVEGAAEPYIGRIIIPYIGYMGDVIYFNARSFTGALPKYRAADGKHPLYVPHYGDRLWSSTRGRGLVLVEGAFDAIKVCEAGYRVACIGGTALPKYLVPAVRELSGGVEVTIALDSDALDKGLRLVRRLQPFVRGEVTAVVLPPGQDPASMTTDQLKEILQ